MTPSQQRARRVLRVHSWLFPDEPSQIHAAVPLPAKAGRLSLPSAIDFGNRRVLQQDKPGLRGGAPAARASPRKLALSGKHKAYRSVKGLALSAASDRHARVRTLPEL